MIFLQTNNLINQDLKSIEYLTILSEKCDFFVYQGTDGIEEDGYFLMKRNVNN